MSFSIGNHYSKRNVVKEGLDSVLVLDRPSKQMVYLLSMVIIITLGALSIPQMSYSATYYISVTGNDSNPGTIELPWRTIQKGANIAGPGDTVIVKSGNYDERVTLPTGKSGTAGSSIVFRAEVNRSVYIKGFKSSSNNYIKVEGFNITYNAAGWTGGCIWLDGNNWEIVNNYFYEAACPAIQPTWQSGKTTNNIYVGNNYVYKCNSGFNVLGQSWLVENNEIERLIYSSYDADYVRFFGENHVFRNNYFHGTLQSEIGGSHVDGFQTFEESGGYARNIIIENNIVKGMYHEGIMATGADGSHDNIIVRNNIFANSDSWGICIHGITNVKIYNNVFAYIYGSAIGLRAAASRSKNPSTGEIKNNIIYEAGSLYWTEGGSTANATNNLLYKSGITYNQSVYPNDILNIDPMFIDPAGSNFNLLAGSPAINAGISLLGFSSDIRGESRPQGYAWDIGAYEYSEKYYPPAPPRSLRLAYP